MKKFIFLALSVLTIATIYSIVSQIHAQNMDGKYQVTLQGSGINYRVFSGTQLLPNYTVSSTTGTFDQLSGSLTGDTSSTNSNLYPFMIEDLNGTKTDWKLEIAIPNDALVASGNGSVTIGKSQVGFKRSGNIVKDGLSNSNCLTAFTGISDSWNTGNTNIELIKRINTTDNLLCKIGFMLDVGVAVPAYQPVYTYTGTVVITLTPGTATLNQNQALGITP